MSALISFIAPSVLNGDRRYLSKALVYVEVQAPARWQPS
jgi:hypothetical protein